MNHTIIEPRENPLPRLYKGASAYTWALAMDMHWPSMRIIARVVALQDISGMSLGYGTKMVILALCCPYTVYHHHYFSMTSVMILYLRLVVSARQQETISTFVAC